MKPRFLAAIGAAFLGACGATRPEAAATSATVPCGAPEIYAGGSTLPLEGGGQLWYRVAGKAEGPTVLVVHGGPGSNSLNFERSIGALVEPSLRMVYLDQRGGGRSATRTGRPRLGMDATMEDLERLRGVLGVERWILLAHSFGGAVALEYERRHADRVAGMVLVETTPDIPGALRHQLRTLASLAPSRFPAHAGALARISADAAPPSTRLGRAYAALGRLPLQRAIAFATDEGQRALERWDERAALRCGEGVAAAYVAEGWLDEPRPDLARRPGCPAVIFAGRRSDVIGAANIEAGAAAWRAPVIWFEESGHFPNIEEPERFARELIGFASRASQRGSVAAATSMKWPGQRSGGEPVR